MSWSFQPLLQAAAADTLTQVSADFAGSYSIGGLLQGSSCFRAVWTNDTFATSRSVTVDPDPGETLLMWAVSDSQNTTFTWPAGFTQIARQVNTADNQTFGIAIKEQASGAETSLTVQGTNTIIAGVAAFTGRNATTPLDVSVVVVNENTAVASPFTIQGQITPVTNGVEVVAFMASDVTTQVDVVHSFSGSGLTWTKHADQVDNSASWRNCAVASVGLSLVGDAVTVTGTGTIAGATAGRTLFLVALRPANALSPVTSDLEATYAMAGFVNSDLAASYNIATDVTPVSNDLSATYSIAGVIGSDFTGTFLVDGEPPDPYYNTLLGGVDGPVKPLRFLLLHDEGTSVGSDFVGSYNLTSVVGRDYASVFNIHVNVTSDLAATYIVLQPVTTDLAATFSIADGGLAVVGSDLAATFNLLTGAKADYFAHYLIAGGPPPVVDELVQRLTVDGMVEMIEIDLSSITGTNTANDHFYFVDGTNEFSLPIVWQGITYNPFPVQLSGFEKTTQGTMPRPSMRASNVTSILTAAANDLDDMVGARVIRRRTFVRYLDAVNFVAGNAFADPNQHLPDDVYYIERKVTGNRQLFEWELASALDLESVKLPGRVIATNFCPWEYRRFNLATGGFDYVNASECGYTGDLFFDANDSPVAHASLDVCSKSVKGCKLRFGARQPLNFGGFPGARAYRY